MTLRPDLHISQRLLRLKHDDVAKPGILPGRLWTEPARIPRAVTTGVSGTPVRRSVVPSVCLTLT